MYSLVHAVFSLATVTVILLKMSEQQFAATMKRSEFKQMPSI